MKGDNKGLSGGFSLVEFLLILAAVTVLLSSVDSWIAGYETRSKVTEAMLFAESAKTDVAITCSANPTLSELSNTSVAHTSPDSKYIKSVLVSGSCELPRIRVETMNTGLKIDPVLFISGHVAGESYHWDCESTGLKKDVPLECQSS